MENAMNRLSLILAVCASGLTLTAGCNKQETRSVPSAAPPAQSAQQSQSPPAQSPPSTPTAPMPPPDAPKDSGGPAPGQANDHSSPAFKDGGKEEKK